MALGRAYIEIVGDVSRFAPHLRAGLTKALKVSGIAAVGATAAAASGQIVGLIGSLASVGGALYALPAAAGVGGAALGALMVATRGLGEAFAAAAEDDMAKFEKAIEDLSPQAQRLVREFRAIYPVLSEVRVAAQDAFSAQLVGQLSATASVLAGPLRTGLAGVAAEWGRAARAVLEFSRETRTVQVLSGLLDTARLSVGNLATSIKPLLAGFRDITAVALPSIGRVSELAGEAAVRFGTWLSAMADSGAAVAAIDRAGVVMGQLGKLTANVGSILTSVLKAAAEASTGGLLAGLVEVTGRVREFFATAEGGSALLGVFNTLGTLAAGLGPVFTTLLSIVGESVVPALGSIAQAIVPAMQAVVTALGPALAAIAGAVGPVMEALSVGIQALAPALGLIGEVIASIALAVAPLLPVIGELITMLVGPLATVLNALGPLLAPIVSALAPVLLQIGQTLTAVLAPVAGLLAELFTRLGPPLGKVVAALGSAFAPILTALGPLIVQVVQALMPLIPTVVGLLPPLVDILVAITPLIELVAQLAAVAVALVAPLIRVAAVLVGFLAAKAVAPLVSAIASALVWLLSPLSGVAEWLGKVAAWLTAIDWAGVGSAIGGAFSKASQAVQGFFESIATWFAALPGKIGAFLSMLPGLLWDLFTDAAGRALEALGIGIGLILYAVTVLPGQIAGFLASLPGRLRDLFRETATVAAAAFLRGVDAVVSYAMALPGRAVSALSSLRQRIESTFSNAVAAGRTAAVNSFNSIVSYIQGIPGRISAYAGRFLSAGSGLVKKLVDGLRKVPSLGSIASAISDTIRHQLNRIIGAINSGIARVDAVLPGSLPRIPMLANGAILRRPTLFVGGEAGDEVVIPLTRPRRARQLAEESGLLSLLAGEAGRGGTPITFDRGAISVVFEGVVPTRQEALDTGRAVGDGVLETLARRSVATTVRTI
ncbi:hypothetical protein HCA58_05165 [Micromonospora sp. HNM0581]|uniref:hypothetical protein n=1 Tax=Micromonospora sp. HNM0581 TaxID=2716341 RepID=UPI00146A9755|nr:hypothetical protein [Micromonospora sp. HNM0581]NLU77795.1 hypothetical protein [Micromonospora sp. HNM0581]